MLVSCESRVSFAFVLIFHMGNFLIRKKARTDEESWRSAPTSTFTSEMKGSHENSSIMTQSL